MAATRDFFAAVAQAIPTPLASKIARQKASPETAPAMATTQTPLRLCGRISKGTMTTVRSSKRGEVLMMHKFEVIAVDDQATAAARQAYEQIYAKPLSKKHLQAICELFPAVEQLID